MSMTDPIADMLTRIRNAARVYEDSVRIPLSNVKVGIAQALKREGFIKGYEVVADKPHGWLVVELKYGPEGEQVIQYIQRTSKPGRRIYAGLNKVEPVRNGLGISIISTSRGILSDREARSQKVGGEILATIW